MPAAEAREILPVHQAGRRAQRQTAKSYTKGPLKHLNRDRGIGATRLLAARVIRQLAVGGPQRNLLPKSLILEIVVPDWEMPPERRLRQSPSSQFQNSKLNY